MQSKSCQYTSVLVYLDYDGAVQDDLVADKTDVNGGATVVTDLARSWVISTFLINVLFNSHCFG